MHEAVSSSVAARLIVRLRVRRLLNRFANISTSVQKRRSKKRQIPLWLSAILGALLFYVAFSQMDRNVHAVVMAFEPSRSGLGPVPEAAQPIFATQLGLLTLVALFGALGTKDLARPEWDLEWLATLPVSIGPLVWIRVLERALSNAWGLLLMFPFSALLAARLLPPWQATIVGALLVLSLLSVVAAFQTVIDTGLKVRLRPRALRNIDAWFSLLAGISLLLALAFAVRDGRLAHDLAPHVPRWVLWTIPGAAVRVLTDAQGPWPGLIVLTVECGMVLFGARVLVGHLLRHGVVAGGSRETNRKAAQPQRVSEKVLAAVPGFPEREATASAIGALTRREFRLLSRDRVFLIQTAILPSLLVLFRLAFGGSAGDPFSLSSESPEPILAVGFFAAVYTLLFALPQSFHHEGPCLWMLYALPRPVATVMVHKVVFWGCLASLYPIAAAIFIAVRSSLDTRVLWLSALVLFGVLLCALLAAAIAVLGPVPDGSERRGRFRHAALYCFLVPAAAFGSALLISNPWIRAGLVLFTTAVAVGAWLRALARLPLLLDPSPIRAA